MGWGWGPAGWGGGLRVGWGTDGWGRVRRGVRGGGVRWELRVEWGAKDGVGEAGIEGGWGEVGVEGGVRWGLRVRWGRLTDEWDRVRWELRVGWGLRMGWVRGE